MAKLFGTNAQISPIRQTRIQPTGIPGSTYVKPQQRETGGNLRALASALGNFNSNLQNFAATSEAIENDPKSRDNREWIARRQQMDLDQLRTEAANGSPDGIRIREDALNAMLGERANDDFRKAWLEFYNTDFDRSTGDAAGAYETMRQRFAEGLPTEISRGNFYRLTKDHFSSWMQKDTEEKLGYAKTELNTTIVDSFRNAIDDAVTGGSKTADEAADIVFAKSAANRDFLGLSGQEQNDTIFRIAQEYALQGREDIATALLNKPRKGADGKTVPPLRKIAGYTDKVIKLLDQAGNIRDRKVREDGLETFLEVGRKVASGAFTEADAKRLKGSGLYEDAQLSALVTRSTANRTRTEAKAQEVERKRQLRLYSEMEERRAVADAYAAMGRFGGINRIRDVDIPSASGTATRTISRQSLIDQATDMKEAEFDKAQEDLIANGTDPTEARRQANRLRLDWYAGNGITNKGWSNTLNGIAGRATLDTLLQKGEVTEYLKASAGLYRDLKATNPAYLSTLISDPKSKEFLETYDNAVSNRRMPDDDALVYAAQTVAQPEGAKAKSMIDPTDASRIAKSLLSDLGADMRTANNQYVLDRIATMSKHGATRSEIEDAVKKEVETNSVTINGMLVFAHRDLPHDFPELMTEVLQKRFDETGERYGATSADDLYVVADGSEGRWYVRSKTTGNPVGSAPITPQSLAAVREEHRKAEEERIRAVVRANNEERAKLKAETDAHFAERAARVEYWRKAAEERHGTRQSVAQWAYEALRDNYDEDYADYQQRLRDSLLTPHERGEKRRARIRKQAEENARKLGFPERLIREPK